MNYIADQHEAASGARAGIELGETQAAFARLKAAMLEELVSTTIDQQATRERLYLGCQILDSVKNALIKLVDAGEAANTRLILAEQRLTAR